VRSSAALRWPSVNASATGARGANAASNFGATTQASAGVDAIWETDLFGATRAQMAAAQARGEQAALGWHGARVSLAADVAASYVSLRACEAQQQVLEQDAESQRQSAGLTREKVRVGFEAPANGALADGAAADATNRAIAQRAECDVLVKSLVVLTGQPEPALRARLQAASAKLPQPTAFVVGVLPAQQLQQRPDIAAAERALVAAAADVGVAEAARYPRLTFSGNLGVAILRGGGGVSSDGTTWGFGPSLVLPIFDAGARAAGEDAARARYDEARAALDSRLRGAVSEVEEALVRLDAATRREGEALRAAQGFRDFFAAAEQRWRIGAGSLIDREDARRTALAAQSALINVQRERVLAWITLYRALGGGWSAADAAPEKDNNANNTRKSS
jgi:NodT family efflux transporter outer membrane factor (OMF) lipoprotein